jgi:hypothetical protein
MNRRWKLVIASLWLFLPLVAFRNWQVWDRLPARLATHFDIAGNPNGWMPREGALKFILIFMAIVLSVTTLALLRVRAPQAASWAILGISCVVLGSLYCGEESILAYNLFGTSVHVLPVVISTLLAVFALTAVYLGTERGPELPIAGHVFATEVHASPTLAFAIFVPALLGLIIAANVPAPVRVVLVLTALVLVGVAFMVWSGFQYLFTPFGVEVRTLNFRLHSIPAIQIKSYAADRWNPIGGYGIRGIGNKRAYVWGNRGVRIHTTNGEVFLGHRDPARIMHDLDAIKQAAH